MVKQIIVGPRKSAIHIAEGKKNYTGLAIISISSYTRDILFTKEVQNRINCHDVLNFVFGDLNENDFKISPELIDEFPKFDDQMAEEIVQFLNKIKEKDIKLLFVHCDAGIARSGAVGVFACRYLGMDEDEFRKENPIIGPNTLVLETLNRVSGLRKDYYSWWKDIVFSSDINFL